MLEERNEILRTKQAALAHLQEKKVMEKEHLTQAIIVYGLWQMKEQIAQGVQVKCIQIENIKSPARFQKKGFGTGVQ